MNILPHKSWHVRTKSNIARVRRDIERARQEEDAKQKRINLAEHEARIVQLRAQAGHQPVANSTSIHEPFDLFADVKDKLSKDSEKEVEKKLEQEKWEVKQGIFSYLDGRHKYENGGDSEWYLKSHNERMSLTGALESDNIKTIKDQKLKAKNDPLADMKRYLDVMKKNEAVAQVCSSSSYPKVASVKNQASLISSSPCKSSSRKHAKKKKKHKKRKHRSSSSESSSEDEEKKSLIEKLRRERLARESKERQRTRQLLGESVPSQVPLESVRPKYNSQFNPHLARQNRLDD